MNWVSFSGVMGISLELTNAVFLLAFLVWGFLRLLKDRRDFDLVNDDTNDLDNRNGVYRVVGEYSLTERISLPCNLAICILYLSFSVSEHRNSKSINFESVVLVLTWVLASLLTLHSKNRIRTLEQRKWPMILVLWWVFSWVLSLINVLFYMLINFRNIKPPGFISKPNVVDFGCLPMLSVLCFSLLPFSFNRKLVDLEHPLLQNEKEDQIESSNFSPFSNAGTWSRLTFSWLNPLFKRGRVQKLELYHIPSVPPSETAEYASCILEESLAKQEIKEDSSLPRAITFAIWKSLAFNAVLAGINTVASYVGPFLITNFVDILSEEPDRGSYFRGLTLAFIFFFAKTVESLSQRQWYFGAQKIGIQLRAALTVLVYKKSLSIKFAGQSNGKIVNLISVDVERIGDFCSYVHGVWLLPVQVFLALIILYRNLGAAPSAAALISTILVMVSNTPLANMQKKLLSKIMDSKDSRIKLTSETLKSMRVLKLNSWEPTFLKNILGLRETERNLLSKYLYTCSAVAFLFWASPTLVSVLTFSVCVFVGTPLTSGTVLSALATFRILQEPIYNLPELVSMIAQSKVSIDRINEFLGEEDGKKPDPSHSSRLSDISIEIEKGEFSWDASDKTPKKHAVKITEKLKVIKGQKVAVCGSVGSGKSSFLSSLLGEIPRISGLGNRVYGKKAYVPQSAWIQTGTVRENVLFGKEMNRAFYAKVVEVCALNQDIEMFKDGDLSLIGERGINLSGGQKQRVQLARAVYSDSDVYILDDPFSAVDAHTGTHLFKKCLMELLSDKTVIYATHQLEFLNAADLVLVMQDGLIVQSGKYEDLIQDSNGVLLKQMNAHRKSLHQVSPFQDDTLLTQRPSVVMQTAFDEKTVNPGSEYTFSKKDNEEETESGRVKWSVYSKFISAAYKGALVPLTLVCQVMFQGLQMGSNYWIAWATEDENRVTKKQLMGFFILLSGGSSFFILGRAVLLSTVAIETGQRLFLGMIRSVFRAPISFFDSTPSSQILQRSSTDQGTVDTDIPFRLAGLVFALIQLFSIIILMSQVAWQVFVLFLIILAISIWYQAYYITTARELARMVGIRKAPILHHFSESIMGAATIRCFNQEDRFSTKNLSLINDYSRVAFHNSGTMEWLCTRINFLFNFVFFIVLVILVTSPRSSIDTSLAGLAATYGLSLNVLQAWVIWNLCNVENKMISVERILQFTKIPSEAPLVVEGCRPKVEWPNYGKIELENLYVRYTPTLPMVLKGITCTFPGEKKIGVVGRTGSGKSTLIQALFRVVEPSEGRILIDGLDISNIGLQDLRSRLGIIPQDPTLFQGTMRTNLDPLEQHLDHEIWEVLKKCRLADIVREDQRLLDAPVAEDGENWSVGQRQLVCLARALLKKRRILVLDEATASIDTATDNVIQETIRRETNGCTVITVAHRIATVIDNDLVLVLDEGKVREYDSPRKLLENNSSAFSKLVAEFTRRSSKTDRIVEC